MINVQIEFPKVTDWDWIKEKHAETAWESLPPELQRVVTIQIVRNSLSRQAADLFAEHGNSNQVFVARSLEGQLAGYAWVG